MKINNRIVHIRKVLQQFSLQFFLFRAAIMITLSDDLARNQQNFIFGNWI